MSACGLMSFPGIWGMFDEEDLVPISALQHVLFCERQYALIHLEQLWEENLFTAEGRILHERVDIEHHESRRDFKVEYGMAIRSLEYGLIGKADVVEFRKSSDGGYVEITPVEFKRGKTKTEDWDNIQLCAQALCLEEMFLIDIQYGQFYYFQEHRRSDVDFSGELRRKTTDMIDRIRAINSLRKTPAAVYNKKRCDCCSISDICMPRALNGGGKNVSKYMSIQTSKTLADGTE